MAPRKDKEKAEKVTGDAGSLQLQADRSNDADETLATDAVLQYLCEHQLAYRMPMLICI